MAALNKPYPELARRLRYAYRNGLPGYRTYTEMAERFSADNAIRAERCSSLLAAGTVQRWVSTGRFPDRLELLLHRLLDDDGVPRNPPEE